MATKKIGFQIGDEGGDDVEMAEKPHQTNNRWAAKVNQNFRRFFKHNEALLVRDNLQASPDESMRARGWLFMFICIQVAISIVYGFGIHRMDQRLALQIVAAVIAVYFLLKLFFILLFVPQALANRCGSNEEAASSCREVMICIPVYKESRANLQKVISSIDKSSFPKSKLFLFFIVDGDVNSYEILVEILTKESPVGVTANKRMVDYGVYTDDKKGELNYCILLKEKNRGRRDSMWLFVEILRNIPFDVRPSFTLFLDSDTTVDSSAIMLMHNALKRDVDKYGDTMDGTDERKGAIGGVTGLVNVANFRHTTEYAKWDNWLFNLTTLFLVGHQYYEYHFGHVFSSRVEGSVNAATLSNSFSMLRTDVLCNIGSSTSTMRKTDNTSKRAIALQSEDFFARPLHGIFERVLYDAGEFKKMSQVMIQNGIHTKFLPSARASNEVPDSIVDLMAQRRRWLNVNFLKTLSGLAAAKLWFSRAFFLQIFGIIDLIGAFLLPVNGILLITFLWSPLFTEINTFFNSDISLNLLVFWWVAIQLVVMTSTKLDTSDMFFVLNAFLSGVLMAGSIYFLLRYDIIDVFDKFFDDSNNWPQVAVILILPVVHLFACIFNPLLLVIALFPFLMIPVVNVTIPMYAFLNMDAATWGSR